MICTNGLHAFNNFLPSALADFDSHGNAAIDNEVSVGALRESDLDASPNADFIDSDVLTPEPAPPEPPKPAETPAPPPASAKGVESRSVVPDDDEIEGLFENLVQDD